MTYPDPHYDEDDTCPCPDHVAMREERAQRDLEELPPMRRMLNEVLRCHHTTRGGE